MDLETKQLLNRKLGRRVKSIRESRGITQSELRKRTKQNAWRVENGQIDPSHSTLHTLADALGVSVEELVRED